MTLRFDPRRDMLTFEDLLPSVGRASPMLDDVKSMVSGRTSRALPAHKRIDARRASLGGAIRRGSWSRVVAVHGGHHAYATRYGLNLVNDLFLLLHERYPDYLVAQFGMSGE
jgi:hypothetical protein